MVLFRIKHNLTAVKTLYNYTAKGLSVIKGNFVEWDDLRLIGVAFPKSDSRPLDCQIEEVIKVYRADGLRLTPVPFGSPAPLEMLALSLELLEKKDNKVTIEDADNALFSIKREAIFKHHTVHTYMRFFRAERVVP
jgi:hypothetical protein